MPRRIDHRVMPAHRMPDEDRRAESPTIDQRVQIFDVMTRAVLPFGALFAIAGAPQIDRQRMEAVREMRRDEIPPVRVRRTAVHEQDRRFAFAAIIDTVDDESVDREFALSHLMAHAEGLDLE